MISIIVAVADNMAIGRDNALLWHISGDLKYFKNTTSGHPVIMGRRTYDSIGRPLPQRRNIVVTRDCSLTRPGAECVGSLDEALKLVDSEDEVFVIGGGQIYAAAIDIADRMYLTRVQTTIEDADTYFPAIDAGVWKRVAVSEVYTDEKSGLKYYFETLDRR